MSVNQGEETQYNYVIYVVLRSRCCETKMNYLKNKKKIHPFVILKTPAENVSNRHKKKMNRIVQKR